MIQVERVVDNCKTWFEAGVSKLFAKSVMMFRADR